MRQRIDFQVALDIRDRLGTGEGVATVDIHGAGTADTLTAGAAEGQGLIVIILDVDQRIENHGAAIIKVDGVFINLRIFSGIRIVAIDLYRLRACRAARPCMLFTIGNFGIRRKRELYHDRNA